MEANNIVKILKIRKMDVREDWKQQWRWEFNVIKDRRIGIKIERVDEEEEKGLGRRRNFVPLLSLKASRETLCTGLIKFSHYLIFINSFI